jgi:hypothetical protein
MQKLDVKKIQFQLKQVQNNFSLLHKVLYYKNTLENKIIKSNKIKVYTYITIRVTANNVFCTLKKQNRTLYVGSAGIYKIHISKKILKTNLKIIISKFLFNIKKKIRFSNFFLTIICAKKFKKKLLRQILKFRKKLIKKQFRKLKQKNLPLAIKITFNPKKCFNGCRASKKIRKKRRYFRITK